MRRYLVIATLVLSLALGGCLSGGADAGSDPISSGLNYYYDEFADVAIPKEMTPEKKETYITYGSDGVKVGTLTVTGQVELASLGSAMEAHMLRDGWALRSVFRSSQSILIFDRPDRMCSIYLSEGTFSTRMLIFVSQKLVDGAMQYSAPAPASMEPPMPSDPPVSTGTGSMPPSTQGDDNVTVYPVDGFSGGTLPQ